MIPGHTKLPLIILLIIAVINDIRFQKIPNLLTYPSMIIGVLYHSTIHGIEGMLFSIGGIGLGLGLLIVFYLMGGMGAGDVKLMGAIGGLLGPKSIFTAFILAALVGGIYAFAILAYHGYMGRTVKRYWAIVKTFLLKQEFIYIPPSGEERKLRLHYGVPIAVGALLAITLGSEIFIFM